MNQSSVGWCVSGSGDRRQNGELVYVITRWLLSALGRAGVVTGCFSYSVTIL